jgi:hypothetical protein
LPSTAAAALAYFLGSLLVIRAGRGGYARCATHAGAQSTLAPGARTDGLR